VPGPVATDPDVYDITIIGGGPVGLFGLFYGGMRNARCKIIDSLPELGGQLAALYPEKYIYDMPGFPKVTAKELVKHMVEQALANKPTVCLGERVLGLRRDEKNVFHLTTNKREHLTRTVVIAIGAGAFTPKKLGNPEIEKYEGKGLAYVVKSLDEFAGKRVLIVGGGDSAVDWSLSLIDRAVSVTLIHRRDQFRAHEDSVNKLMNSAVKVRTFHELRSLAGGDRVRQAVIFHNKTRQEETIDADAVVLNLGFTANLGPIKEWGVETRNGDIAVNSRMETNIPGVYCCGDVATYDGKLKLIATGVGEACVAVNHAKAFVDPHAKAFPGHSSTLEAAPGAAGHP
jgi:thioredoxin reductase (NADPH)